MCNSAIIVEFGHLWLGRLWIPSTIFSCPLNDLNDLRCSSMIPNQSCNFNNCLPPVMYIFNSKDSGMSKTWYLTNNLRNTFVKLTGNLQLFLQFLENTQFPIYHYLSISTMFLKILIVRTGRLALPSLVQDLQKELYIEGLAVQLFQHHYNHKIYTYY